MFVLIIISISIIVGYLIGLAVSVIKEKREPSGMIRIIHSEDGNDPYIFLELNMNIESIVNENSITLLIRSEKPIPQK